MRKTILVMCILGLLMAGFGWTFQGTSEEETSQAAGLRGGLTVMTRNVYIGANVDLVIEEGLDKVGEVLAEFMSTSYPDRARGLTEEFAEANPQLIGLQEIYTIDLNIPFMEIDMTLDFLDILMATMQAYGLNYYVVGSVENTEITIPAYDGFVSLTDYDVILARDDVQTANVESGRYVAALPVPQLGPGAAIYRGYVACDATVGRKTYRFVNTHLEPVPEKFPEVIQIQMGQAAELISILQDEAKPVILVGDLNTKATTGITYNMFVNAGYVDVWTRNLLRRNRKGYTAEHDSNLRNETVKLDKRIDLIFVRSNISWCGWQIIGPVFAWVVGDELDDKVYVPDFDEFIWPSDHAGVVALLWIPILR